MVFASFKYWQEPQWQYLSNPWGQEPALLCGIRSHHHITEATTFTHHSSAGTVVEPIHIKVQHTALSILAGWKTIAPCTRPTGYESWAGLWASGFRQPRCTQLISNLLLLGSVLVPATGSRLWLHIWSCRPSVAGFPSSFMFTLAVTELKKFDQHKTQWNRQMEAGWQNLCILASNISRNFQNTLKHQNYTMWNSKYWLPE